MIPELKVPYLHEKQVERAANELLHKYAKEKGKPVRAPIDVENILEGYFKLDLVYIDLPDFIGVPDVLGATFIKDQRVFIDESLMIEGKEGRLAFVARERPAPRARVLDRVRSSRPQRCDRRRCRHRSTARRDRDQTRWTAACRPCPTRTVRRGGAIATWGVIDSPMAAVRLTYGATTHDAWRAGVTPVQFARRLVVLAAAAPRWPNGTRKVVEFGA